MYTEADVDAAIAEGAITAEAAAGLRDFVERRRAAPLADEEQFRLLTGFNDIFVSIAAVLLLVAVGWLAGIVAPVLGTAAAAVVSWGLAEYFTRRRRMALPSILLLAGFVAEVGATGAIVAKILAPNSADMVPIAAGATVAAIAAVAHWRRFRVPITVAVGSCAAVAAIVALLMALVPAMRDHWTSLVFVGGLSLFAWAMRWDMTDRARTTRRSDVAFWLHLSAAPLIVHPAFTMLGLLGTGAASLGNAGVAVGLYVVLALVALAIDRRALLVSALFYVLYAISALFQAAGALNVNLALTALVVGSALLLLSAFWHQARRLVLWPIPEAMRRHVPTV